MLRCCSRLALALAVVCGSMAAPPVQAQDSRAAPTLLRLGPQARAQEIKGQVTGYQQANYVFDGYAGQGIDIRLEYPGRVSLYHNLIAPSGATLFVGSRDGERFQGTLRERGRYRIQVYLMRNDARRAKRTAFTLRVRQDDGQAQRPDAPPAGGPAFDCRQAQAAVEHAICRSRRLSGLDARLDLVYRAALDGAPPHRAERIRMDQRAWLQQRNGCARERDLDGCLERRYSARLAELTPKT